MTVAQIARIAQIAPRRRREDRVVRGYTEVATAGITRRMLAAYLIYLRADVRYTAHRSAAGPLAHPWCADCTRLGGQRERARERAGVEMLGAAGDALEAYDARRVRT